MTSRRVESYGVLRQRQSSSRYEPVAKEVRKRGYSILEDACGAQEVKVLSAAFNRSTGMSAMALPSTSREEKGLP